MATDQLAVLLYGRQIATLEQTAGGQHVLHYSDDPGSTQISLSMPLAQQTYKHRIVEPFLNGLLPDDGATRDAIGRQFGVSGRNPFALLSRIGMDCAGAIQFCHADQVEEARSRKGSVNPLSEADIEARLAALAADGTASWLAPEEHWSLGGAQAKFALRNEMGRWWDATGSAATTHIFKPGVGRLKDHALNEHISLSAAGRLGLSSARTQFVMFGSQPAIVVERYDRRRDADGTLQRIHQEDMCQALSVDPSQKYEADGGPGVDAIMRLLRQHSDIEDRKAFAQYQAFNYLIGGTDAHAKNLSVLLAGDLVRLAPLYDAASGLPYDLPASDPFRINLLPMQISGENKIGYVRDSHWARFATKSGLEPDWLVAEVHTLTSDLPDAVRDAFGEVESSGVDVSDLRERLLTRLRRPPAPRR